MEEKQATFNKAEKKKKKQKKSARLAKKYHAIWDKIRYRKIEEIEKITNQVIAVFDRYHQDGRFMVTTDYLYICALFQKMRRNSMFYMSLDASSLIGLVSPKYIKARFTKKDYLKLKYIGSSSSELTNGKIYKSRNFTDTTCELLNDNLGKKKMCCRSDFEIVTKSC